MSGLGWGDIGVLFAKIKPTIRRGFMARALYDVKFPIYLTFWGVIGAETIQLYIASVRLQG